MSQLLQEINFIIQLYKVVRLFLITHHRLQLNLPNRPGYTMGRKMQIKSPLGDFKKSYEW